MSSKAEIRREMALRTAELTGEERRELSSRLCQKILLSPEYVQGDSLFAFYPNKGEIDILPLLRQALNDKKSVCLPRVEGQSMAFYEITNLNRKELPLNRWGIAEPGPDSPLRRAEDFSHPLMLVPGTAFTERGNRLGRGGGYYDRYLAGISALSLAGVAYPFQIREELPIEPHDIPMDRVFY
ncbi:MAG: 5-formyltetrahydrofolate cyclo-ligase [Spirochaetales bacterium]|nr:5-formyltetrahydrofolate cyclo-ligase [Spirochaetales bacterium]